MDKGLKKLSVIVITLDGARYDRIKNFKNFQSLVSQNTLFSKMITYAPYTIAAMYAIFSGAYGNRNGVDNYYGSPNFRKKLFLTLPQYLKDNGYFTEGDILNEICVPNYGFDKIKVQDQYKDDLLERHSDLLVRMAKLKKSGKYFFAFLHYSKIQNSIKINVSKKYNNFSKEYFRKKDKNMKAYDSYIAEADGYLGAILKKIDELCLQDSMLIVHADHGMGVGEKFGEKAYGVYCYDYTLKTFAVFKCPNIFPKKEIEQQVRTVDITPTILDCLGIKENPNYEKMDGKSLVPLINGGKDERVSFSESGNPYPDPKIPPKQPNVRAIRTSKWKFVKNYWNNTEELYDLEKDPEERKNIIKKEKKTAKELKVKLNLELRKGFKVKLGMIRKSIN